MSDGVRPLRPGRLRRRAARTTCSRACAPRNPSCWQDMPGEPGYWAVLRHADVVRVAREPVLFSAATGGVVLEDLPPETPGDDAGHVAGDGPAAAPRRTGATSRPQFTPKVMARLEPRIREICRDDPRRRGRPAPLDFVHDVCAKLPSQVVGELMGIPREDWPRIHHWSEMNSGGQDPDIAAGVRGRRRDERDRRDGDVRDRARRAAARRAGRGPHHARCSRWRSTARR